MWHHLPELDQDALIGACARLRRRIDGNALAQELAQLPEHFWGDAGRASAHAQVDSVFLRGYAAVEGPKPVEDREALAHLPLLRALIHGGLGTQPARCVLARLRPASRVPAHIDSGRYFRVTLRLHVPLVTSDAAWVYCDGLHYRMQPGEIWAINKTLLHGALNEHAARPRTHLICDYVPDPSLLAALSDAERGLGEADAARTERLGWATRYDD